MPSASIETGDSSTQAKARRLLARKGDKASMKEIPASVITLVIGVIVTLISLWVGQNHGLLPEQASEQAPLVDGFFNVMVTIGTALCLVVEGAM